MPSRDPSSTPTLYPSESPTVSITTPWREYNISIHVAGDVFLAQSNDISYIQIYGTKLQDWTFDFYKIEKETFTSENTWYSFLINTTNVGSATQLMILTQGDDSLSIDAIKLDKRSIGNVSITLVNTNTNADSCAFVIINFNSKTTTIQTEGDCSAYVTAPTTTKLTTTKMTTTAAITTNKPEETKSTDTTEDSFGNNDDISDSARAFLQTWEFGGTIVLVLTFTAPCLLFIVAFIWHRKEEFLGVDRPRYASIFKCFWNIGDLWSDLIFTIILYFNKETREVLFMVSLIFATVPHIISNLIALYEMKKWRQNNARIAKYIDRYDWFIIAISIAGGFYSAIELGRSKLFYAKIFLLQLKREEYHHIKSMRFYNNVVFEV